MYSPVKFLHVKLESVCRVIEIFLKSRQLISIPQSSDARPKGFVFEFFFFAEKQVPS